MKKNNFEMILFISITDEWIFDKGIRLVDLLRSFDVFQKVAELGSFTGAANVLGIVPSAVSRQINELEEWAGLKLINRTTRSLHLTAEGQLYFEKLTQIAVEVQYLKSLSETERNPVGHINLTAPMMLGQFVLPDALARFKKAHPNVSVSVTVLNRMVDIIEEGFDVAIRGGQLPDSTLMSRKVATVRMLTIASPAYLDEYGIPETPRDLATHNCLTNEPPARAGRWRYQVDNKETIVKVSGDVSVNESLCLKSMALAGLGIIRIPGNYVVNELDTGALIPVLPDYEMPPMPIHIVHTAGRRMRPTLRVFIDTIAEDLRRNT